MNTAPMSLRVVVLPPVAIVTILKRIWHGHPDNPQSFDYYQIKLIFFIACSTSHHNIRFEVYLGAK